LGHQQPAPPTSQLHRVRLRASSTSSCQPTLKHQDQIKIQKNMPLCIQCNCGETRETQERRTASGKGTHGGAVNRYAPHAQLRPRFCQLSYRSVAERAERRHGPFVLRWGPCAPVPVLLLLAASSCQLLAILVLAISCSFCNGKMDAPATSQSQRSEGLVVLMSYVPFPEVLGRDGGESSPWRETNGSRARKTAHNWPKSPT